MGDKGGLLLAKQLGLTSVIVELDASVVVAFLRAGVEISHPHATLVFDCLALLQEGKKSLSPSDPSHHPRLA